VPSPAVDLRAEVLYAEPLVAVVAGSRPAPVTLAQLCAIPHVSTSRRGLLRGPLDDALAEHGLTRNVAAVTGSFITAVLMAHGSTPTGAALAPCGRSRGALGASAAPNSGGHFRSR
jgi:DNA-binding transcriptional LysR family regulator